MVIESREDDLGIFIGKEGEGRASSQRRGKGMVSWMQTVNRAYINDQ